MDVWQFSVWQFPKYAFGSSKVYLVTGRSIVVVLMWSNRRFLHSRLRPSFLYFLIREKSPVNFTWVLSWIIFSFSFILETTALKVIKCYDFWCFIKNYWSNEISLYFLVECRWKRPLTNKLALLCQKKLTGVVYKNNLREMFPIRSLQDPFSI